MIPWIQQTQPTLAGVTIDFRREMEAANGGQYFLSHENALPAVQNSPGEWTLYVMRELPSSWELDGSESVATIEWIDAQLGMGGAAWTQRLYSGPTDPGLFTPWDDGMGSIYRCTCYGFHASVVGVSIRWSANPRLIHGDRLHVWLAPGRPAPYEVCATATGQIVADPGGIILTDPDIRGLLVPPWATRWMASARLYSGAAVPGQPWNDAPLTALWTTIDRAPVAIVAGVPRDQRYQAANGYPGVAPIPGTTQSVLTGWQPVPATARYLYFLSTVPGSEAPEGKFPVDVTFACFG